MNEHDDYDADEPSRANLIRRIRELERENWTLEQVLEGTFKAWLSDRKRLAKYEDAELIASFKQMMEHPQTTYTLRDVLDEIERDSRQPDQDGQSPV
jgi:hypothetical protein